MPNGKILIFNNKVYCGDGISTNSIFTVAAYIGNQSKDRFINLGYTPEFVLVFDRGCLTGMNGHTYGGLCLKDNPTTDMDGRIAIQIAENGFYVNCSTTPGTSTNTNNNTYNYIAY